MRRVEGGDRHPRRAGFRDGFVTAAIIVALALATGLLGVHDGTSRAASLSAPGESPVLGAPGTATAGDGSTGDPTPAVTPDFPCASARATGTPQVELQVAGGPEAAGAVVAGSMAPPATEPAAQRPVLAVASGKRLDILLPEGPCATSWLVTYNGQRVAVQDNVSGSAGYAAQVDIAFALGAAAPTQGELRAHLVFAGGDLIESWIVGVSPPTVPPLTLINLPPAGSPAGADMVDGCGFAFDIPSQSFGQFWRTCSADEGPASSVPVLHADPGARLLIENSGFTPSVRPALPAVACGHLTGQPPAFLDDPSCALSYAPGTNYLFGFRLPDARGSWVIAVRGCVAGLVIACGAWYAEVDTAGGQSAS